MKKRNIYIIVVMLVISTVIVNLVFSQSQGIDLLWKARALQAVEKIEEFTNNPPEPMTQKDKYEMMVEVAYAFILKEPKTVIKKRQGATTYHLIFNIGDRGLDVLYTYDDETQDLLSIGIDRLPKGWRIVIPSGEAKNLLKDYIVVSDIADANEPTMLFSTTNPFSVRVVPKTK